MSGEVKLTATERAVLEVLALRPNGAMIRGADERLAVLGLADKVLVCDPHEMRSGLFTRITPSGLAVLQGGGK